MEQHGEKRKNEIEAALVANLPDSLRSNATDLAQILTDVSEGKLAPTQAKRIITSNPFLLSPIEVLAGQTISSGNSQIQFGNNNQIGDITIRDVFHGNSVHITSNTVINQPIGQTNYILIGILLLLMLLVVVIVWSSVRDFLYPSTPNTPAQFAQNPLQTTPYSTAVTQASTSVLVETSVITTEIRINPTEKNILPTETMQIPVITVEASTPTTLVNLPTPKPVVDNSVSVPTQTLMPTTPLPVPQDGFGVNVTKVNTNGVGDICSDKSSSEIYAGVFDRDGRPIENALVRVGIVGQSDAIEERTDASGLIARKGLRCAVWAITLVEAQGKPVSPVVSITLANVINGSDGTLASIEFNQRNETVFPPFYISVTKANANGLGDTCSDKSSSEIYAGVFDRDGRPIENALVRVGIVGQSDAIEERTDASGLIVRKGLRCAVWAITLVEAQGKPVSPAISITLANVINGSEGALASVEFREK